MKLQTRFLLMLAPLALGAGALITFSSLKAIDIILADELAQQGIQEAADYASRAAAGLEARDESALLPVLQLLSARARASYAMALDNSGTVEAHTNIIEKGKSYDDEATRQALRLDRPGHLEVRLRGEPMLDISIPVWAPEQDFLIASEKGGRKRLGVIRLGLPLAQTNETKAKITAYMAAIMLLTGLLMIFVLALLLKRILQPIRLLSQSAVQIGRGKYGVQVPVLSSDELGELARSFNRMSSDIAETTVSKDYLDGILNHMLDALIVAGPEGAIRTVNKAAAGLLGYAESELVGQPVNLVFDRGEHADGWALMNSERATNVEIGLRDKSGARIPALVSSSVAREKDGRAASVIILARDITERKAIEARMGQNEKLSAIGQLAAGVAHEINNPLGVILGFSQSLVKRLEKGSALELPLKSIERESLRCKELVQSLLIFSRQGNQQEGSFDLPTAMKSALALIETQARIKSVEVASYLGSGPLPAEGNANQIQQIVINLCSNAIDAMAPRGGLLTVALEKVSRRGRDFALISVKDTGTGIPKALQDKIFLPFFTTKEPGKGTGLGLALVYELVQKHHGEISFDTMLGEGTTFRFLLPLSASPAEAKTKGARP